MEGYSARSRQFGDLVQKSWGVLKAGGRRQYNTI